MSKTVLKVTRSQIGHRVRFALSVTPTVYQNPNVIRVELYEGQNLIDSIDPILCYYRNGSIDSPEVQEWIVANGLLREGRSPIGLVLCEFEDKNKVHSYRVLKVLSIKQQYKKRPQVYCS